MLGPKPGSSALTASTLKYVGNQSHLVGRGSNSHLVFEKFLKEFGQPEPEV